MNRLLDAQEKAIAGDLDAQPPWWKQAPLTRREVGILFGAYVVLAAVYSLVGLAITHWWDRSDAGNADADFNRWLADRRTPTRTDLADLGSALSNTETKIVLVLGMLPLMLWMYRRWRDWALLAVALLLEVSVFGTASEIVRRDRPPVEQLDGAPTNSWPSGHIAACIVFYVGLAIVIVTHNKTVRSKVVAVAIAVLAPTIVITSRLYLGMHYLTDAIGGVVLGAVSLLLVHHLLEQAAARRLADPSEPTARPSAV